MHIFNHNNRPQLILTTTQLLIRKDKSDEEMKRYSLEKIAKISLKHAYDTDKRPSFWLKIETSEHPTPVMVPISSLDTPLNELLAIFSHELQGKVKLVIPSERWLAKKSVPARKGTFVFYTIIGLCTGLFILHKTLLPKEAALEANTIKVQSVEKGGFCSLKVKTALTLPDKDTLQIKTYCGVLGMWKNTQTKTIDKRYLQTEFSLSTASDYMLQANQALDSNQSKVANDRIDDALYLEPDNANAYVLSAKINYRLGLKKKTLDALLKASELNPGSPSIAASISSFYLAEDKHEEALLYAKRSLDLQKSSKNFIRVADLEKYLGKQEDAIKAYEHSLDEDPDNAYVLKNLGLLYWQSMAFKKAAETFKKAYKTQPEDSYSFLNYYEASLVASTTLDTQEKERFVDRNKDLDSVMIIYDMLSVIHLAIEQKSTEEALNIWKDTYDGHRLKWSFQEIRNWLDASSIDIDHKQTIQSTIGFFIGYQQAYKINHTKGDL